jgi:hypothetical protein
MNEKKQGPDLDTVMMQFWNAFGAGAGRFMDADCHEVARKKGYLRNIKRRLPTFADKAVLDRTLRCCFEAGQLAAMMAVKDKKLTISGAMFLKAVEEVEHQQADRIAASPKLRKMIEQNLYGGVC